MPEKKRDAHIANFFFSNSMTGSKYFFPKQKNAALMISDFFFFPRPFLWYEKRKTRMAFFFFGPTHVFACRGRTESEFGAKRSPFFFPPAGGFLSDAARIYFLRLGFFVLPTKKGARGIFPVSLQKIDPEKGPAAVLAYG